MSRREPIPRIGLQGALKLLEQGYKLMGTELVSPVVTVSRDMGIYGYTHTREGGNAEYHVTRVTAEKLRALTTKDTP